ncbi:Plasmodium exported protein, unknown function [Plasmodium sp. gorilla clade G3]|nr:Plasmodium exported protein, unknown function [Plasmodium sp. gorilla clade G3]
MKLNKDMKKMHKNSWNCIFFKIFIIVIIFCILQCASYIDNNKLPYLQAQINMGNKLRARNLASVYISEQRYKKIEMNSSDLEKKWKNICFEWRSDLNDICKQIFWEFKKVCIKNNVNVDIENETWKTWRDEVQNRIKMKEDEDNQDYLEFKETPYTTKDMDKFIYEKTVSFKLFNDELLSEKDSFIKCFLSKWLKYKEDHFDTKGVKELKEQCKKIKLKMGGKQMKNKRIMEI